MMFDIENLVKTRERETGYRLEIRSLCIRRGDKIAITGPSGCGKSTTLDMLGLVLCPDSAKRFLFTPGEKPTDILQLWKKGRPDAMAALRRRHIGYVLQTGGLLPFLNVGDNMKLTARMNGLTDPEAETAMRELAERLGIAHLAKAMPETLSVGERQRAAIVRALAPSPQLVLADEPTAALDPLHAEKVLEAFLRFVDERGGALVMVTHDASLARRAGLRELGFVMEQDEKGVRAVLDGRGTFPAKGATPCTAC